MHWFRVGRVTMMSSLSCALLAAPPRHVGAQAAAAARPGEWSEWAFGRLGSARTSQIDGHGRPGAVLGSLAFGIGASHGAILGMARVTDTQSWSFGDSPSTGVQDYALLAGLRSRRERVFVSGAAGLALATPSRGALNAESGLAPTYDLTAHADYGIGGVALTVSGVLGPASIRYLAASLGVELGSFGFH